MKQIKTKIFFVILVGIFLQIILLGCSDKQSKKSENQETTDFSQKNSLNISVITSEFPLRLNQIDFENKDCVIQLNDSIISKIKQTINNYLINDCDSENSNTHENAYINTIYLHDSLQTIFLVLLKHVPTEKVNSKVLFYNNLSKEFSNETFDFNLHALYNFNCGKLEPANFKENFKITVPEIEIVDYDKNGINDYKFVRLYHNGTYNAIHTTILTICDNKIETLMFEEKPMN